MPDQTFAFGMQFGTAFSAPVRRLGRVTQGIWVQSIRQSDLNLLVLDIEGTGGTERATNPDLERRMGVLALTAADIVILNINNVLVENAATVTLLHVILQVTA